MGRERREELLPRVWADKEAAKKMIEWAVVVVVVVIVVVIIVVIVIVVIINLQ